MRVASYIKCSNEQGNDLRQENKKVLDALKNNSISVKCVYRPTLNVQNEQGNDLRPKIRKL